MFESGRTEVRREALDHDHCLAQKHVNQDFLARRQKHFTKVHTIVFCEIHVQNAAWLKDVLQHPQV